MAVIDNLNIIKQCKEDIKQAIINKGVDMTNVAFTEYATKIYEIPQESGGGGEAGADFLQGVEKLRQSTHYYSTHYRVPSQAFAYDQYIESVDLPNAYEVGWLGFYYCTSLQSANLPSCTMTGGYIFQSCSALRDVNLPIITPIDEGDFFGCQGLTYIDLPACRRINTKAFENCINLNQINIPNCSYIAAQAFSSCNALYSLDLPNCTHIDGNAFRKCSNLTTVSIPRCSFLNTNAFNSCLTLTQVDLTDTYFCQIPNSNAFLRCPFSRGEGQIYIRAGQRQLYNDSFWSWYSQCFVEVGDPNQPLLAFDGSRIYGDTNVIYNNFSTALGIDNYNLTAIDLPNCTEIVGDLVFADNYNLTTVNMPNCSNWGYSTFMNCTALSSLDFVYNTSNFGNGVFAGCTGLTTIDLPNCIWTGVGMFENCVNISSVNLPNCEQLARNMFSNCTGLTSIDLPNVQQLNMSVFTNCVNLQTVNLPKCTRIMGGAPFVGCNNITLHIGRDVDFVAQLYCPLDDNTPNGIQAIYVPMSLVDAYKTTDYWSLYADRIFGE